MTAPLVNKGSQENGISAIPCRGYNPSVFSACKTSRKASSPYTVGFRAPPVADTARKASRCRPQVRERIAEARAANGEGAEKRAQFALQSTGEARALPRRTQSLPKCEPAVKPAEAGCPHPSRCGAKAQHRATFPQGEGFALRRRAQNCTGELRFAPRLTR